MGWRHILFVPLAFSGASLAAQQSGQIAPEYFNGRWAFTDETCGAPTNWTLMTGGNFLSENLAGSWNWQDGKLVLRLDDLAIDEETGELGGRFRMDGPVTVIDQTRFDFTVEPEVYQLKRCP
ncbi:hypothetical protein [Parasphingorhabdus sp.]|uniref:hypothetical protein n=1 Tax=Parasphingorhabdus sp. TaxID=2709688 RepID=UPI003A917AAD